MTAPDKPKPPVKKKGPPVAAKPPKVAKAQAGPKPVETKQEESQPGQPIPRTRPVPLCGKCREPVKYSADAVINLMAEIRQEILFMQKERDWLESTGDEVERRERDVERREKALSERENALAARLPEKPNEPNEPGKPNE